MSNYHVNLVDRAKLADIPSTKWLACKAVLRAIAEHANEAEADMAWPGLELLMIETGASESVITRATNVLAEHEWISKKRRGNSSNLYRINVAKLQQHQVARPEAGTVFMSEHLSGMEFSIEQQPSADPSPSGRSTARARAQQRRDQANRQIDESESSNRRERPVKSTVPNRQIDDRTHREPSGNPQPTNARAHAREEPSGEPAPAETQWMDEDVSDNNDDRENPTADELALDLINSCIPAGRAPYRAKTTGADTTVAVVREARETLTDDEIRRVLSFELDFAKKPAAMVRTHRCAELLAVVQKRQDEAGRPVYCEELPALWCTHCSGIPVEVTTPEGSRSRKRCSDECSAPRDLPGWVWNHITDKTTTDDTSGAPKSKTGDLPTPDASDESTGETPPKFVRPSERGQDPWELVNARKRELSRFTQQFGVSVSGGTQKPQQ